MQRKIGPAWAERGRPPAGHAEEWLRDVLDQARKGNVGWLYGVWGRLCDARTMNAAPVPRYPFTRTWHEVVLSVDDAVAAGAFGFVHGIVGRVEESGGVG